MFIKYFVIVKTFLLANKFLSIGFLVIFTIVLSSILYANSGSQSNVLGEQTKATITPTPVKSDDPTPTISSIPTVTKTLGTTPTPTAKPIKSTTSSSTTNSQNTVTATNTPVPATATPTQAPPSAGNYVINGVTFSSLFPTISIKPGEQKTLFTMKAVGNKNFVVDDFRLIGSNGLGLSEMTGSITDGQTKEILLTANPDAKPGSYSGFIGVVIDGVYGDQKLRPTVIVEGANSENAPSLNLTGPAAGSTYNQGDSITITWEASNISENFSLSVEGNNGDTYSFANVSNSERTYTWTATKYFAPNATHFRFTIGGGGLLDHSDGDIIIH